MKNYLIILSFVLVVMGSAAAQTNKLPVYGELGAGIGQTLIDSDTRVSLQKVFGGSGFAPAIGTNLLMGFYVAPQAWHGLGLGSRMRGTFGGPANGDAGDRYIFNYYSITMSAKYYPSGQFNRGFYARGSYGFGQFTAKRLNEDRNIYIHQYALGSSVLLGAGYTLPVRRTSLSLEGEWELSSRNGTVNGTGDVNFRSGQLGLNLILAF